MKENRKKLSEISKMKLFNEVNGICPLCHQSLIYKKGDKEYRLFEGAHIYPLNATPKEKEILKKEKKLFVYDVNELDNMIALCPNCHTRIDKPTTVETYRKLYNIKKNIIEKRKIIELYSEYTLEKEIIDIVNKMTEHSNEPYEKISYKLVNIDNKFTDADSILLNKVKYDVTQYYLLIKKLFADMEKEDTEKFEIIAGQVKMFYLKVKSITKDKTKIYNYVAEWLYNCYGEGSKEAYLALASFFVQDCEVFEDVSK